MSRGYGKSLPHKNTIAVRSLRFLPGLASLSF
jgi:hypothetical protein